MHEQLAVEVTPYTNLPALTTNSYRLANNTLRTLDPIPYLLLEIT